MNVRKRPTRQHSLAGPGAPERLESRERMSAQPNLTQRVFFPNLDGLRFLAFFLVYLQHGFGVPGTGGVGVAFFFVLSGFLITYLILTEIDSTGHLDVGAFYVRRILRIWPLYYATLAFCFVVYPLVKLIVGLSPTIQAGHPIWYLLFLSNFDVIRIGGVEGAMSTNVTWSVAIEEQFYLTWPLLFRFVPRRRYLLLYFGVICGSLAFRLANVDHPVILYFHSASVISDMAIGGLAAHLWRQSPRLRHTITHLSMGAVLAVYAAGSSLFLVPRLWGGTPYDPVQRIAIALFFTFVVLEQNFCCHSPCKASTVAWMTRLGRYTYGLYLLHALVITILSRALLTTGLTQRDPWYWITLGPAGLAASIVLATVSYHRFEKRFLQLKSRFTHVPSGGS
jgi:peptidoglycan/LPS O-acetylase OafA/YrhL